MSDNKVSIQFMLDGKVYASRNWSSVPRIGDEIMLKKRHDLETEEDKWGKVPFSVDRVVWGTESISERTNTQCVNIAISPIYV